jgi:hypothetical protein
LSMKMALLQVIHVISLEAEPNTRLHMCLPKVNRAHSEAPDLAIVDSRSMHGTNQSGKQSHTGEGRVGRSGFSAALSRSR